LKAGFSFALGHRGQTVFKRGGLGHSPAQNVSRPA
jgi:hypothetical protein